MIISFHCEIWTVGYKPQDEQANYIYSYVYDWILGLKTLNVVNIDYERKTKKS